MDFTKEERWAEYYRHRDKIIVEVAKTIRSKRRLQSIKIQQGELLNIDEFCDKLLESCFEKLQQAKKDTMEIDRLNKEKEANKNQLRIEAGPGGNNGQH